jgi:hypothetical protein
VYGDHLSGTGDLSATTTAAKRAGGLPAGSGGGGWVQVKQVLTFDVLTSLGGPDGDDPNVSTSAPPLSARL